MITRRLIKMWLVLTVVLFVGASALFALLGTPSSIYGGAPILGWLDPVIAGAIFAITTSPLVFAFRIFKSKGHTGPVFDETKCPACDYDLTGLESDRCPECGRAVDRAPTGMDQSH
jgi:hypothetical protein